MVIFSHSSKNRKGGSDEDGNVNADNIPENLRELVQALKEIVNCPEQEIYAMLVECNMDPDEAINRLLSQDDFQQVKSKRDKKKKAKEKLINADNVIDGFGSETTNVQEISNHSAGSSTTSVNRYPSLNSDVSNVETKGVTISSGEAVPSLSVPSSKYQSARGWSTSDQRTMADVVKMSLDSSKESVTKAPVKYDSPLPEKPDDLSLNNLNIRDGTECHEEDEQRLRRNVGNEEMAYPTNSNAASNYHSSSKYGQTEQTQESQCSSSAATFTYFNSQLFNPFVAPSSLQMQNFSTFPEAMHQQAYTREPDACYSASPLNQSVPTAVSMTEFTFPFCAPLVASLNEPQMNQHYSQPNVPSGHHGTKMNYPYSMLTQNNTYTPPSTYQQHGGSNNDCYDLRSTVAPLPQNINDDMRHAHRDSSPYGSGMSSYNAANSRLVYDDVFSSQFRNHLASLQHLNGNSSNVWTPPQEHNESRRNYYSLFQGHQNQDQQNNRYRQQQEQPYRGTGYENERNSRYYASLDQRNNRRDPSNPTQQGPWPRNNY